ncbi:MAG: GntR family transcriptional regulator, partial [Burkholderiales bacterium PBB5]
MDDDFAFSIQTGSAEPIYRQLVEHVRRRVASGQIRAGDEIPSVRELAQQLAVHPMTISKAYSLL